MKTGNDAEGGREPFESSASGIILFEEALTTALMLHNVSLLLQNGLGSTIDLLEVLSQPLLSACVLRDSPNGQHARLSQDEGYIDSNHSPTDLSTNM